MKILMLGPPKGHNIKLYLDYFQYESVEDELFYMYFGKKKYSFDEYSKIQFLNYLRNFYKSLCTLSIYINTFDLVWIHNWTRPHIILFLFLFRKKSTKINFSIWSEPVPRKALKRTFIGRIYKFIFNESTFVQCLWYGTYDIIKQISDDINVILFPWGLPNIYFQDRRNRKYRKETLNFVSSLSDSKVNFFWPKSISKASRHDLVIEATYLLKRRGVKNFKVYLWLGNAVKINLFNELKFKIKFLDVADFVEFVDHEFLPFEDVIFIWERMDAGLQIAEHDALSTSLLEPLLFKKEIVISDILPYRRLEKEFGLNLNLVPLKAECIEKSMLNIIKGKRTKCNELNKRSAVIEKNFKFSNNTRNVIDYMEKFEY